MKTDKIRIEKIKTWNKHKQKKTHTHTHTHTNTHTIKKRMKINETRKGKYSKIILREKKITNKKKPNKE